MTGYWHVQRTDVAKPYYVNSALGKPYRFADGTRAKEYAAYLMLPPKPGDIARDV